MRRRRRIAIESARLYAESAEKARIENDLRVAADIQQAMLPEPTYDAGMCELAAVTVPCRTVGGDFYDYVDLAENGFGFALGDVAGKGPPAALLAATVQSNFVAHAPIGTTPADTMTRINKALLRRAIEARFATMFYGVVIARRQAGLLQRRPGAAARLEGVDGEEWLETGGPVIGLLPIDSYDFGTIPLTPGDLVIVCSDGVSEARNVANEEFGLPRMLQAVEGLRGQRPEIGARASPGGRQGIFAECPAGRRHHHHGPAIQGVLAWRVLVPDARELHDHLDRLLHVLHGHPLEPRVKVVLAGKDVGRRQTHER